MFWTVRSKIRHSFTLDRPQMHTKTFHCGSRTNQELHAKAELIRNRLVYRSVYKSIWNCITLLCRPRSSCVWLSFKYIFPTVLPLLSFRITNYSCHGGSCITLHTEKKVEMIGHIHLTGWIMRQEPSETPVKSKRYWSLMWTLCQACSWKLKYSCTNACPQGEEEAMAFCWGLKFNPPVRTSEPRKLRVILRTFTQKTDKNAEEGRGVMDKGIFLLRPKHWPQHMMSFWKCVLNEEITLCRISCWV